MGHDKRAAIAGASANLAGDFNESPLSKFHGGVIRSPLADDRDGNDFLREERDRGLDRSILSLL
jgi:hypothetical protein